MHSDQCSQILDPQCDRIDLKERRGHRYTQIYIKTYGCLTYTHQLPSRQCRVRVLGSCPKPSIPLEDFYSTSDFRAYSQSRHLNTTSLQPCMQKRVLKPTWVDALLSRASGIPVTVLKARGSCDQKLQHWEPCHTYLGLFGPKQKPKINYPHWELPRFLSSWTLRSYLL